MSITLNEGKVATGRRDHFAAYYQQAVFVTGDEAFDDDAAAFINGHRESRTDFGFSHQVGEDATTMVAIRRFHDHGQADIFGGFPGVVSRFNDHAFRHRYPAGLEQALGEIFISRDRLGNGAGLVGFCRPDAALLRAVTQLHQIVFCQAHGGDLALHGGIHNTARAWAEQAVFRQVFEFFNRRGHIERLVFNGGHNQVAAHGQCQAGDFVMQVVDDDFVNAATTTVTGTSKTTGYASQAEQLQGHMLHDVCGPGAFVQAFDETAVFFIAAAVFHQAGQPRNQPLG